jgi:hypothetical protein
MDVVYATGTFFVGLTRVDAGTVWPASDPIVKSNPNGFSADPIASPGFRATARPPGDVEQATAAPGEKRNARRG